MDLMAKTGRRSFLRTVAAGGAAASVAAGKATGKSLPTILVGNVQLSRMIAGGNPMRGFSHSSKKLSLHMMEYFTAKRITEFLLRCEQEGINTFQSSYSETVRDGLRGAWEKGSKIQFICLHSASHKSFDEALALKPVAVCHHGGVTDSLFRAGKDGEVLDFVKRVHDAGVSAGVSSHNPDNLARIEDAGWETDLYMACFYNMTRTRDELRKLLGDDVLGEVFLASDPARMTQRVREISKPCLGFKILAAGRLTEDPKSLEGAFRFAYENVKPRDALIVGMYPKFSDEVGEDAALARRFSVSS